MIPAPLGSQLGSDPSARKRGFDPSAFMSQIVSRPGGWRTKAIVEESGDQLGS
jgi:hypothetical protein